MRGHGLQRFGVLLEWAGIGLLIQGWLQLLMGVLMTVVAVAVGWVKETSAVAQTMLFHLL